MRRLTVIMVVAATAATLAATLASPLVAQENDTRPSVDFGTATGTFTTLGFNKAGDSVIKASSTATDEIFDECIVDTIGHHIMFSQDELFSAFDIATRAVCETENWGVTFTTHYGSPIAISRLKNNLGS